MSEFQHALHSLLPDIMSTPRLYPQRLDMDKDMALIIDADQGFYRNAVFLDQRALNPNTEGAWVPLNVIRQHMDADNSVGKLGQANFIFHIGHCGSTLISRLLDEAPNVLGLREPLLLRSLATHPNANDKHPAPIFSDIFKRGYQLLARRFSPQQQVIIKPTSICNNLASQLLQQNPDNRGIMLYVTLEVYLANMLDKPDSVDINHFLEQRLVNLKSIAPDLHPELATLSRHEKIAVSWLSEISQLIKLGKSDLANRAILIDFDQILTDTAEQLEKIFLHFSIPTEHGQLEKALASPVFKSYSKQPGFSYTASNRGAILDESRKTNQTAIKSGIEYVENLITNDRSLSEYKEYFPLI